MYTTRSRDLANRRLDAYALCRRECRLRACRRARALFGRVRVAPGAGTVTLQVAPMALVTLRRIWPRNARFGRMRCASGCRPGGACLAECHRNRSAPPPTDPIPEGRHWTTVAPAQAGSRGGVAARRAYWRQDDSDTRQGGVGRGALLRRDRREGPQAGSRRERHAGCPSQVDPTAPTAGEQAAHTRDIGRLACGPHNAGRMQATQCETRANERTDRYVGENDSVHVGRQRHHAPHGHGQGMDTATIMDMATVPRSLYIILFLYIR
jgi:hypothetical protein